VNMAPSRCSQNATALTGTSDSGRTQGTFCDVVNDKPEVTVPVSCVNTVANYGTIPPRRLLGRVAGTLPSVAVALHASMRPLSAERLLAVQVDGGLAKGERHVGRPQAPRSVSGINNRNGVARRYPARGKISSCRRYWIRPRGRGAEYSRAVLLHHRQRTDGGVPCSTSSLNCTFHAPPLIRVAGPTFRQPRQLLARLLRATTASIL
jgi:hypothetical protein